MKTILFSRHFTLMTIAVALSVWFLSSCKADETDNVLPNYDISGSASGTQNVPSVSGTGSAALTGSYNPNTRLLTYNSSWVNLSGAPTGGGFYSGASGATGSAVGTPWVFNGTTAASGSTSGSLILTPEQADELLLGRLYFTYKTASNPSGEVRGQVNTSR